MKKLYVLISLVLLTGVLAACGASEEAEELAEYHNNYVETVNELANKVDVELANSYNVETPEEALELQKENVMPLVDEITSYIESQEPKTDVVKELNDKRLEQLNAWSEAMQLNHQALEESVAGAAEDEINQTVGKSDEKLAEAQEKAQKADEFMAEMANEHDVELTELEEK